MCRGKILVIFFVPRVKNSLRTTGLEDLHMGFSLKQNSDTINSQTKDEMAWPEPLNKFKENTHVQKTD
jgi:hypothetical protein